MKALSTGAFEKKSRPVSTLATLTLISGGLLRERDWVRKRSPRVTRTHRIITPVTPKAAMLFSRARIECIFPLKDAVKRTEGKREEEREGGKRERKKERKEEKQERKKE